MIAVRRSGPAAQGKVRVKICGLTRPADVEAALAAGAGYIGLVFFAASPRAVDVETARALALTAPPGVAKVALVVDPDDAALDAIVARVPVDMIQLHGGETPDRVRAIRARTGLPVMKAVGIRGTDDLATIAAYEGVADQILVDAKPPKGAALPGGNGIGFDWTLLSRRIWRTPWMLAGGLTTDTVALAIRTTGATQVDVSSGVEVSPGRKSPDRIAAFCAAASAAASQAA